MNRLLLLCALITSQSAYADTKFNIYTCSDGANLETCSGCAKTNVQFSFKVQPLNNVVIGTSFENGKMVTSNPLSNCSVVNQSNWQCDSPSISNRMVNGIFIQSGGSGVRCGKSSSIFNFLN